MKHLISRQADRRELFKAALPQMPRFQTWTTEERTGMISLETLESWLQRGLSVSGIVIGPEMETKHHARLISRRTRRSMARDLSKMQYRNARTV